MFNEHPFHFCPSTGVQLSLAEVKLINNELELTVQLSGYEGETNSSVTVVAGITDNINGKYKTNVQVHVLEYCIYSVYM